MIAIPTNQRSARDALREEGLVRLPCVIAPDAVAEMREHARRRIGDFSFVEIVGAMRPAAGTELGLWAIGREPALASLADAVATAVGGALGPKWTQVAGEAGGLLMPNLPCPEARWQMSDVSWHVDEATPAGGGASRVVLAFALLDDLEPGGGATVAVAGSPRRLAALADRLGVLVTTEVALAALPAEEPWFAALIRSGSAEAPREGCEWEGIPLRVEELTGEAGDVVLMDARCLHTVSANVSPRPRLKMRMTFVRDQATA